MKQLFLLFFLVPFLAAHSQKPYEKLDSTVSNDGRVFYGHTTGFLKGKKRIGEWKYYQSSTADTNKRMAWSATYDNGRLIKETHFNLDSYTLREYKTKNVLKREAHYRYGKIVSERLYDSKTSVISKTYYSDGTLSGEGKEVLVKIIAGCDAGMLVYQKFGTWKYYDIAGNPLDNLEHTFNKNFFEKV